MKGFDFMKPKLTKLVSLVLTFILAVSAVPFVTTSAAATSASQIKQQIKRTYSKSRSSFGGSFDGYCGTLTGYQLYYMGITTGRDRQNGKDGYDRYCSKSYSSGGYSIKAYSGKRYSLKEALNAITDNGSKNAYNILVGFESTPSSAGRRYGHSCVIHGIVDGQVYFMESYGVYLNGTRYKEGAPISCSISDFCAYYKSTTTKFDGVIHFGGGEYVDECESYPTSFRGLTTAEAQVWSQPCTEDIDDSSELEATLEIGTEITVEALLKNEEGEYWYQLAGKSEGYVMAELVRNVEFFFKDVTVKDITAPSALRQGRSFNLKGKIETENNQVYSLRSQVYSENDPEPVFTTADLVEGDYYNLKNSNISQDLAFRDLALGSYRFELAAVIGSYYLEAQQLQVHWETVKLWSSEFRVTEKKSDAVQLTFDPVDGTVSVNSRTLVDGQSVGTLPTAQLADRVFMGWFTEAEGGQRIAAEDQPEDDMTLYAHYSTPQELEASADRCWYIYADGLTVMGCAEIDGELYYFTAADPTSLSGAVWTSLI